MRYILAIESSGPVCSVACVKLDTSETVFIKEDFKPNQHSKVLAGFVDEAIKSQETNPLAIALSKGPGSYTGLRIGTSLAKGLCMGFDIPLISVATLEAMCASYVHQNTVAPKTMLMPMIDARRMEVYTAAFDVNLTPLNETKAVILESGYFDESNAYILFGDGAQKVEELGPMDHVTIIPDYHISAVFVGKQAVKRFEKEEFENIHLFEPYYHKQFAAGKPKKWFS